MNQQEHSVNDGLPSEQLIINYVKSNFHRVIRIDGFHSTLKNDGDIMLELFSERRSIPKRVHLTLDDEGEVKDALVDPPATPSQIDRELEVSLSMSIETATSLVENILEMFDLIETEEDAENDDTRDI